MPRIRICGICSPPPTSQQFAKPLVRQNSLETLLRSRPAVECFFSWFLLPFRTKLPLNASGNPLSKRGKNSKTARASLSVGSAFDLPRRNMRLAAANQIHRILLSFQHFLHTRQTDNCLPKSLVEFKSARNLDFSIILVNFIR